MKKVWFDCASPSCLGKELSVLVNHKAVTQQGLPTLCSPLNSTGKVARQSPAPRGEAKEGRTPPAWCYKPGSCHGSVPTKANRNLCPDPLSVVSSMPWCTQELQSLRGVLGRLCHLRNSLSGPTETLSGELTIFAMIDPC